MLPDSVVSRLLRENSVLGLIMRAGTINRVFYFNIDIVEGPDNLIDFSLGAATAQSTTGTDWDEITDSAGRYHLEPEDEDVIYHTFFGIYPRHAWLYRT